MAETARTQRLRALAGRFPASSERVAQGQQAARAMQVQQAAAAAPRTKQAAQAIGATSAAQAGDIAAGQAQRDVAARTQIGQQALAEQGRAQRARTFGLGQAAGQEQFDLGQELARQGQGIKEELFDRNLQFRRDEAGRSILNDRQLLDWKLTQTQDAEELRDTVQEMQQVADRKIQVLEQAFNVLEREEKQRYDDETREQRQARLEDIALQKESLRTSIQREQADAQKRQALMSGGLGVAGAVVGALGGPAGAAVGFGIGQGLGTLGSGIGN